ncbi:hypothetical protein MJ391_11240 [Escherichia coli]|nr:hypothetical protein MJ391_11240 [Escherichia coli]
MVAIEQDGTPREIYEEPKNLFVTGFIGEINMFNATVIGTSRQRAARTRQRLKAANVISTLTSPLNRGKNCMFCCARKTYVLTKVNDDNHAEGLIGYVRERNYKGMTLESVVELENGKMVMVSEILQ